MKTCWRKLSDFNNTAAALRIKYHQAIRKLSPKRRVVLQTESDVSD